jgi:hypothetical protein
VALTPDIILRTDDTIGDVFLTFLDPSSRRSQAVALVENLLATPMGVTGEPLIAALVPGTTIDSSTPVEIAITTDGFPHPVTNYVPLTPGSAEVSAVISTTPTTLLELRVILDPTALVDRWVMLFDASSLPVDTTEPLWRGYLPGGSSISESWGGEFTELPGLPFPSTGIVAAVSSTPNTLTVTGAEAYFQAVSLV